MTDKPVAESWPDHDRPVGSDPRDEPIPTPPELEVADDDLVLGEVDKDGHGSGTFIAKGNPIPAHLAALPRRPAAPRESRKR